MKRDNTLLFILLNDYASSQHNCSVAELFMNGERTEYLVCLHPKGAPHVVSVRFDCIYLQIDLREAEIICSQKAITTNLTREMGDKLPQQARQM